MKLFVVFLLALPLAISALELNLDPSGRKLRLVEYVDLPKREELGVVGNHPSLPVMMKRMSESRRRKLQETNEVELSLEDDHPSMQIMQMIEEYEENSVQQLAEIL